MGLSHMFWSLAIAHAVWTRNRIGHSHLSKNESPYQILHKQAPKLNMARVFGSWCWKFDHMAKGFQKKSDRQIFVGYSNDRKGWLCFDTTTFRVTTSVHLTFDEDFNNRRNALISYDKHLEAGAHGVSPDEKRTLKLVRELYRPSNGDLLVETFDAAPEGRGMTREAEDGGKKQAVVPADSDRQEARRQRPTAHKKNTRATQRQPRIADPVSAVDWEEESDPCLLYTSPSPRDLSTSRMPSSA